MKFYSEITKKLYDTEEELIKAEDAQKKTAEQQNKEIARQIADILTNIKTATAANEKVDASLDKFYSTYKKNASARKALEKAIDDLPILNYKSYHNPNDFWKWFLDNIY